MCLSHDPSSFNGQGDDSLNWASRRLYIEIWRSTPVPDRREEAATKYAN